MPNPIIAHKCTADPTALVVNDRMYLYTGHDEAKPDQHEYIMNKWLCFSSSDLTNWTEHPDPLSPAAFQWANGRAYASCVAQYNNNFYWFVAVGMKNSSRQAIGVAVAARPEGPFRDAKGSPLIDPSVLTVAGSENFDPSVLVDDDGIAHIYWGKNVCYHAILNQDLTSIEGKIETIDLPLFEEGAHIHKQSGWYYLSYGYSYPEKVAYAMSRSAKGPWAFKGLLNELAGNCATNRPCIIQYKNTWYFIYHNGGLQDGGTHRRSVCIDYLYYNEDGTMKRVVMTSEGIRPDTLIS